MFESMVTWSAGGRECRVGFRVGLPALRLVSFPTALSVPECYDPVTLTRRYAVLSAGNWFSRLSDYYCEVCKCECTRCWSAKGEVCLQQGVASYPRVGRGSRMGCVNVIVVLLLAYAQVRLLRCGQIRKTEAESQRIVRQAYSRAYNTLFH
jgi:hypothetical protein